MQDSKSKSGNEGKQEDPLLVTCAICRCDLVDKCIECEATGEGAEACHMAKGKCGHCYHQHCIARWLESRAGCPMDNIPWEVVSNT